MKKKLLIIIIAATFASCTKQDTGTGGVGCNRCGTPKLKADSSTAPTQVQATEYHGNYRDNPKEK